MMKSILIDDEINNLEVLAAKLTRYTPQVEILKLCASGEEAIRAITSMPPDLLFLDIEMPVMNGFQMLQQIPNRNFEIIFVTAYDQYAINAIKYSALDYLVKPVDNDDLIAAVGKAEERLRERNQSQRIGLLLEQMQMKSLQRIALPTMEGLLFISVADIIYLQANGNYTDIFLADTHYLVSKPLKEYEEMLPADTFLRIHHSHIINKNAVSRYLRGDGGQVVLHNGVVLDVSKRKKTEFLKVVAGFLPR